jgi:hypothetical protein
MKKATLLEIVSDIRLEIGASPNIAQGISFLPAIDYLARRNQEIIYNSFNWPHLIIDSDETLVPGERYYSFDQRLNRDRIMGTWVKWSNSFTPVKYGFNTTIYNASMPEGTYRADPVQLWRFWEEEQYEVWPTPANEQILRWRCVRNLNPFLAPEDKCDVDATLIVLFTAAELLTKLKSTDAQAKNALAQAHFAKLKAQMQRTSTFVFGGTEAPNSNMDWTLRTRRIGDTPYVPVN